MTRRGATLAHWHGALISVGNSAGGEVILRLKHRLIHPHFSTRSHYVSSVATGQIHPSELYPLPPHLQIHSPSFTLTQAHITSDIAQGFFNIVVLRAQSVTATPRASVRAIFIVYVLVYGRKCINHLCVYVCVWWGSILSCLLSVR